MNLPRALRISISPRAWRRAVQSGGARSIASPRSLQGWVGFLIRGARDALRNRNRLSELAWAKCLPAFIARASLRSAVTSRSASLDTRRAGTSARKAA